MTRADEAARLSSLLAHEILDTGPDTYLDNLTRIVARKLRVPMVLINIIASDRQWAKAAFGLPRGFEVSREHAFCSHTILTPGRATVIADTLLDARVATSPLVTGKSGFRFYAGAPILDAEGRALGAACVLDIMPREFGPQEIEAILELAETVSARLEYYRAMAVLRATQRQSELVATALP